MKSPFNPPHWLFLLIILALGLTLRLDFLLASNYVVDADEAVVGLMAKHILQGQQVPTFYYGQHYMGSFEAIITSIYFRWFGVSSAALKAVPLTFSLLLICLVYRIGYLVGGSYVARVSSFLLAVSPSALVVWSSKARGGFIETVFLGAACVLLTLSWLESKKPNVVLTAAIGLILGFGWWVNNQIIYFMLPIGFVMLARIIEARQGLFALMKHGLFGLLAWFVGGAPFWSYNLDHEFVSLEMFHGAGLSDALKHVHGVFLEALPMLLGGKRLWGLRDVFFLSTPLVLVIHGILLVIVLTTYRAQVFKALTLRVAQNDRVVLPVLVLLSAVSVFTLSSFGGLVEEPRYLLPIYSVLFVLTGLGLKLLSGLLRGVGLFLVLILALVHLASAYLGERAVPGEPFVFQGERVSRDQSELISWLTINNYHWVRTNYWIGYRLAFETKEAVKFMIFQAPHQVRIRDYEQEGLPFKSQSPFVLVPSQGRIVRQALDSMGARYKTVKLSGYEVIFDYQTNTAPDLAQIPDEDLSASATLNGAHAQEAIDGNLESRWATAHPQEPGIEFNVKLSPARSIRAVKFLLGQWSHDYPRGLEVKIVKPDGSTSVLVNAEQFEARRYLLEHEEDFLFSFPAVNVQNVVLTLKGSHPILDWSIAELKVYQ